MRGVIATISILTAAIRSNAWLSKTAKGRHAVDLSMKTEPCDETPTRRHFLGSACLLTTWAAVPQYSLAVRAIGGAEVECREKGNCLETGEWDGAVGWNWGGKERCEASDPLCGPDGRLRESIVGKAVPQPVGDITHVAAIRLDIGRAESGVLKLGLYGNDCPGSVQQLIDYFSEGLMTIGSTSGTVGMAAVPISLAQGGIIDSISPRLTVDFGVPSQANAYARSRGLSKAGDNFVVQPRPPVSQTADDKSLRKHDAAGLLSVSTKGLGYGGTGFETDDEAFESSFLITADSVSALDKNRRVVGQVLDAQSMAFLERLASLPTKKGLKGVIPGQTSGPPLLKVIVGDVGVTKVSSPKSLIPS